RFESCRARHSIEALETGGSILGSGPARWSRLGKAAYPLQPAGQNRGCGTRVPPEGINVMRLPSRLLFVSWFLPVSLLLVAGPGAAAQDGHGHGDAGATAPASAPAAAAVRWSDPAAWPEGK